MCHVLEYCTSITGFLPVIQFPVAIPSFWEASIPKGWVYIAQQHPCRGRPRWPEREESVFGARTDPGSPTRITGFFHTSITGFLPVIQVPVVYPYYRFSPYLYYRFITGNTGPGCHLHFLGGGHIQKLGIHCATASLPREDAPGGRNARNAFFWPRPDPSSPTRITGFFHPLLPVFYR
jgi:hypothetical protein